MWLLVFSFIASIMTSQITAPAAISQSTGTVFNHSGADTNSRADSCIVCHGKGLNVALATNDLCFGCHGSVREKSAKRYHHPPVPNQKYPNLDCEGCHKLHKAPAQKLLAVSETDLCYSCHPETREYKSHPVLEFNKGFGIEPIKGPDGRVIDCASHCHDIHGTDFGHLCTKEPGRELCIYCHKDFQ